MRHVGKFAVMLSRQRADQIAWQPKVGRHRLRRFRLDSKWFVEALLRGSLKIPEAKKARELHSYAVMGRAMDHRVKTKPSSQRCSPLRSPLSGGRDPGEIYMPPGSSAELACHSYGRIDASHNAPAACSAAKFVAEDITSLLR